MNRILSFWTSLQDRERAIMKILAIAILIGLASLFYTNILGSINQNKNILSLAHLLNEDRIVLKIFANNTILYYHESTDKKFVAHL